MDSTLKILHPDKDRYLSLEELKYYYIDGYYKIIGAKETEKLTHFLKCYEDFTKNDKNRITDENVYSDLPFSIQTDTWKERQKDINIIDALIKSKNELEILDIGSWNGWLPNYYTKKGHNVIAINMFTDEFNGLTAHKKYQTRYISLQLMTHEIYRIQHKFDVIIFNRNWAYFQNHQNVFNDAKKLLSKNGIIVFTGLPFYKNPNNIITSLVNVNRKYKNKYDIDLLYKPSKGYLEFKDKLFFKENNIQLFTYHKIKSLIKKGLPKKVILQYGLFYK